MVDAVLLLARLTPKYIDRDDCGYIEHATCLMVDFTMMKSVPSATSGQ